MLAVSSGSSQCCVFSACRLDTWQQSGSMCCHAGSLERTVLSITLQSRGFLAILKNCSFSESVCVKARGTIIMDACLRGLTAGGCLTEQRSPVFSAALLAILCCYYEMLHCMGWAGDELHSSRFHFAATDEAADGRHTSCGYVPG